MKARNDCEIACDCVKRANVVLHVRLCKEIFARKHTATHKPTSAQLGGSEKERKGGRNAALVSSCDVCLSRARGHLVVARVTEQQQGMADEVVFTLVLSISSVVRVWLSRKQASSIGYSAQIVPYPSRGNRSLSKFSPSAVFRKHRAGEKAGSRESTHTDGEKQQMVDYA